MAEYSQKCHLCVSLLFISPERTAQIFADDILVSSGRYQYIWGRTCWVGLKGKDVCFLSCTGLQVRAPQVLLFPIPDERCLGYCFCHRLPSYVQRLQECCFPCIWAEHVVAGCMISILCRIAPLVKWVIKRAEESLLCAPLMPRKPLWLHSSSTLFS